VSRRTVLAVLAGLLAVLAVGAAVAVAALRQGDGGTGGTAAPPSATGPTSTPPTASSPLSPLTGRSGGAPGRVLAVKIDNVPPARPQTGLSSADVVYVEPVEGGLSRIMAIYSSKLPARIGPVRSARESDLELLREYGRPGLAFSGANKGVLAAIRKAPVVDLSPGRRGSAYSRSSSRQAPHNLFLDPRAALRGAAGVSVAKDIGFTFGAAPAGGTPTTRRTVRYTAASTAFSWSPARRAWEVSLDGRAATATDTGRLRAATVVVQYVQVTNSRYRDTLGNTTPYTHSVGSGRALVLRDGRAYSARWSRPAAGGGTTFSTAAGAPLDFAAGPVWVVFAAR
jgi:hypothetical protein